MKTIYLAQRNADLNEGRGPNITLGGFVTQEAAKKAAAGWGVMGFGDGDVVPLKVYDTFAEYAKAHREEVIEKALRKLTAEEKEILGL